APHELCHGHPARPARHRRKYRHWAAIDGDDDLLAGFDTAQQPAHVIAQLALSHLTHATTVAHMLRRMGERRHCATNYRMPSARGPMQARRASRLPKRAGHYS